MDGIVRDGVERQFSTAERFKNHRSPYYYLITAFTAFLPHLAM